MSSSDPRSWLDRAVGATLSVLVAALAVFIAAKLIAAVATILLVTVGVGLFVGMAVLVLRGRSDHGW
ncbi:MAG: hypothetical protein JWN95_445 [Frankiales bacterium]|nr:hypothetical protein [Frankiales bacterium]